MKAFNRVLLVGMAMVATVALAATPARAAAFIDFGTGLAGTAGTFTLLAGGHASGVNIPVGVLNVGPTGQVANCPPTCVYDTSGTGPGNNIPGLFVDPNGSAVLNFNTLTNTISVVGGVPGLGIANGTILLSGSFVSWNAGVDGLTNAVGPDAKHPALLAALGIPVDTPFVFFGFALSTGGANCNESTGPNFACGVGHTWSVTSTDIRNDAVPEPGSLVLLGTGLFGLAALARRRMRKS